MKSFRPIPSLDGTSAPLIANDALMLRLHYQNPTQENSNDAEIGQTLWLTTDVARQFISILEAGIAKIESGEYQENEYRRH